MDLLPEEIRVLKFLYICEKENIEYVEASILLSELKLDENVLGTTLTALKEYNLIRCKSCQDAGKLLEFGFSQITRSGKQMLNLAEQDKQEYNLTNAKIANYAPNAQGSNIINAQTITGNTFIGTQNNYGVGQGSTPLESLEGNPLSTWKRKLSYLQGQEAIIADPSLKFQLQEQIKECQDKIRELGG